MFDPSDPFPNDDIPPTMDPNIIEGPRIRRPTAKIIAAREDVLPEGPGHLSPSPEPALPRVILHVSEKIRTLANRSGLSREYRRRPTRIPGPDLSPPLGKLAVRPIEDIIDLQNKNLVDRFEGKESSVQKSAEKPKVQKPMTPWQAEKYDPTTVDF